MAPVYGRAALDRLHLEGILIVASFSQSQVDIANTILRVGQSMGASALQIRAAFAAAWVESRFQNLNYGDRDSLGVFQQRPSQGWGTAAQVTNVEYAARKFFEEAMRVSQSGTPGQLAQRVQRSGYPSRYDEQIAAPDELLARLTGGSVNALASADSQLFAGVSTTTLAIGLLLIVLLVTD